MDERFDTGNTRFGPDNSGLDTGCTQKHESLKNIIFLNNYLIANFVKNLYS